MSTWNGKRFFNAPLSTKAASVPCPNEAPVTKVIFKFSDLARSATAFNTTFVSPPLVKPLEPTVIPSSKNLADSSAVITFDCKSVNFILSNIMQLFLSNTIQ